MYFCAILLLLLLSALLPASARPAGGYPYSWPDPISGVDYLKCRISPSCLVCEPWASLSCDDAECQCVPGTLQDHPTGDEQKCIKGFDCLKCKQMDKDHGVLVIYDAMAACVHNESGKMIGGGLNPFNKWSNDS